MPTLEGYLAQDFNCDAVYSNLMYIIEMFGSAAAVGTYSEKVLRQIKGAMSNLCMKNVSNISVVSGSVSTSYFDGIESAISYKSASVFKGV